MKAFGAKGTMAIPACNHEGEFRDVVDKVIQYSQEKKYIPEGVSYDIDSIADEIVKGWYPL
jgi:hypothetical protein